jgi:hypothetical protein
LSGRFLNHPAHAQRGGKLLAMLEKLGREPAVKEWPSLPARHSNNVRSANLLSLSLVTYLPRQDGMRMPVHIVE